MMMAMTKKMRLKVGSTFDINHKAIRLAAPDSPIHPAIPMAANKNQNVLLLNPLKAIFTGIMPRAHGITEISIPVKYIGIGLEIKKTMAAAITASKSWASGLMSGIYTSLTIKKQAIPIKVKINFILFDIANATYIEQVGYAK